MLAAVRSARAAERLVLLTGICLIACYVLLVEVAVRSQDYDSWAGLVVVPLILAVNLHLVARVTRGERWLFRIMLAALLLKALATAGRYAMGFVLYGGGGDAGIYHAEGERLSASYRDGDFGADLGRDLVGTGFIRLLTGVVYTVTGPSVFVAYAVFASLGYWGLYYLYRAFEAGLPDGDHRRYAILVFFLPSMLFWPAGLGKDAWMAFGIGLTAMGAARLLGSSPHWGLPLLAGLMTTAMVRPHITAALFAGLAAAVAVRRTESPRTATTPLTRGLAMGAVIVAGLVIVRRAASFLGVEDVSATNVDAAIESTQERTTQGGSEFTARGVNSPSDLPWAAVSVLFRPFVFEADSPQAMLVAAEGTALLVLVAMAAPRLAGVAGRLRRQPYLVVCLVYTCLFIYAFSNFGNFGILTRQRVQVLPFVLVLLALRRPTRPPGVDTTARPATTESDLP